MLKERQIIVTKDRTGNFVNNPPIAAGDYQISLDGTAFGPLANLPTVIPGSPVVEVMLSETERAASRAVIRGIDQTATKAWTDNFTIAAVELSEGQTSISSAIDDIRSLIEAIPPTDTSALSDATTALNNAIANLGSGGGNTIDTSALTAATAALNSAITAINTENGLVQNISERLERVGGPLNRTFKSGDTIRHTDADTGVVQATVTQTRV